MMDRSCSDDSEIEEERAGGGPGPTGGGPGADPGRRRLSGVLAEHSLIGRRRRLGVRADSACGIYICTRAVTTIPKWY